MSTNPLQLFEHVIINNNVDHTLFLFHGTGGTKNDFLFLDTLLEKKYNLVGLQGNVRENGMPRFFRRFETGVFDQESIAHEVSKLKRFITAFKQEHQDMTRQTTYLGYSNGANILLASLFSYPSIFNTLVLLHAMLPFENEPRLVDLSHNKIFLSNGSNDPMVSSAQQAATKETLESCKATVELHSYDTGHQITKTEMQDIIDFLLR